MHACMHNEERHVCTEITKASNLGLTYLEHSSRVSVLTLSLFPACELQRSLGKENRMENLQAYSIAEVSRQQDYPRKPFIICFQYPLKGFPTPNYIFISIYLIINKGKWLHYSD